jgi:hypothetical protein
MVGALRTMLLLMATWACFRCGSQQQLRWSDSIMTSAHLHGQV